MKNYKYLPELWKKEEIPLFELPVINYTMNMTYECPHCHESSMIAFDLKDIIAIDNTGGSEYELYLPIGECPKCNGALADMVI